MLHGQYKTWSGHQSWPQVPAVLLTPCPADSNKSGYIHIYIYIYICTYRYTHAHIYIHMYIYIHTHAYLPVYIYIYIYVCVYVSHCAASLHQSSLHLRPRQHQVRPDHDDLKKDPCGIMRPRPFARFGPMLFAFMSHEIQVGHLKEDPSNYKLRVYWVPR